MKALLIIFFSLAVQLAAAQRVVDVAKSGGVDQTMFTVVGGEPFVNVKFVNLVEGTPYFSEKWLKGTATTTGNHLYRNQLFRLDLIDNELHFLNNAGKEMVSSIKVKELILVDTSSGDSYHLQYLEKWPGKTMFKKGWYLELVSGKAGLYQLLRKEISETRPYGSATVEQRIATINEFYLLIDNDFVPVKKLKDAPALFHDKKAEVATQLKLIDAKYNTTAEKLQALVSYYNSL